MSTVDLTSEQQKLEQRLFVHEKKQLHECFKDIAYGLVDNIKGEPREIKLSADPHQEIRKMYILLDESISTYKELYSVLQHLPDSKENVDTIHRYSIHDFSTRIHNTLKKEKDIIRQAMQDENRIPELIETFREYQQNIKLPYVRTRNGLENQLLMEKNAQIHIHVMILMWNVLDERISFINKLI